MSSEATVTRTYRTAIRCGEDFITIEETITLPVDASDDQITAAVETGLRIYRAQQAAIEQQAAEIRDQSGSSTPRILDPEAPASEKQRSYLDALLQTLDWPIDVRDSYLREHGASYDTLTKGQASLIIDELKTQVDSRRDGQRAEQRTEQPATAEAAAASAERFEPASDRQLKALENLAREHRIDLAGELRSRFGVRSLDDLSAPQAAQLLRELQPAQRRGRQDQVMQERRR